MSFRNFLCWLGFHNYIWGKTEKIQEVPIIHGIPILDENGPILITRIQIGVCQNCKKEKKNRL
jgi:hypothetical protein